MPENNSPNNNTPPAETPERKSALRTMKSDIETLFKTSKPSFVKIVSEGLSRPTEETPLPQHTKKTWRILAVFLIAALILGVGGMFAFLLITKKKQEPPVLPLPPTPPAPFFATETSRTITVHSNDRALFLNLVEDTSREAERPKTMKRVLVKLRDNTGERFATAADIFALYRINPPAGLLKQIGGNVMITFFYDAAGPRIGMSTKTNDIDRTFAEMISWEPALLNAFSPLFFTDTPTGSDIPIFEDRTYRNIDWRYLKLSPTQDIGIGYATFPAYHLLIITTNKEMMETTIDRLFEAR